MQEQTKDEESISMMTIQRRRGIAATCRRNRSSRSHYCHYLRYRRFQSSPSLSSSLRQRFQLSAYLLFYCWTITSLLSTRHVLVVNGEKAYPNGCLSKPTEYYDYDNSVFPPTDDTIRIKSNLDYLLVRRLGAGKFSDVFEAVDIEKEKELGSNKQQAVDNEGHGRNDNNDDDNTIDSNNDSINPDTLVVIKCLKPVSERKIKRELLVLKHVTKLPNLARLLAVVIPTDYYSSTNDINREESSKSTTASAAATSTGTGTTITTENNSNNEKATVKKRNKYRLQSMPSLVLEHAGINSQWLCHATSATSSKGNNDDDDGYLTEYEIKYYLYHLLIGLDSLHSCGIMHRDVKPRNVLINRYHGMINKKKNIIDQKPPPLMLIDLGLADFYFPNTKYNVRVASRHYKSPELLLGYVYYDYAIDMWSVGCILAGLLMRREPFFRG